MSEECYYGAKGSCADLQTIVPEAGDRSHNTCKDGVAPGMPNHRTAFCGCPCLAPRLVRPHCRLAGGTVTPEIVCDAGLFAIEILAQCPGGGWRTLSEWKTIFATAGYSLKDTKPVGSSMDMLIWQQDS